MPIPGLDVDARGTWNGERPVKLRGTADTSCSARRGEARAGSNSGVPAARSVATKEAGERTWEGGRRDTRAGELLVVSVEGYAGSGVACAAEAGTAAVSMLFKAPDRWTALLRVKQSPCGSLNKAVRWPNLSFCLC